MKKQVWECPNLEVLNVSETMNGRGAWIDSRRDDANPRTPGAYPPES